MMSIFIESCFIVAVYFIWESRHKNDREWGGKKTPDKLKNIYEADT